MKKILSIIIIGLMLFNVYADNFKQRIARRIPKNISKQAWIELREIHKAYSNENGEAWDPQNANTEYFVANLMRKYYKNKIEQLQSDNQRLLDIEKNNKNIINTLTEENNKLQAEIVILEQKLQTAEYKKLSKTEIEKIDNSPSIDTSPRIEPQKSKTDILTVFLFVILGIIFCFMIFNQIRQTFEKSNCKNSENK